MSKTFYHDHKHHVSLWLLLLFITAISGYYAFSDNLSDSIKDASSQIETLPTSTPDLKTTTSFNNPVKIKLTKTTANEPKPTYVNSKPETSTTTPANTILAVLYVNDQKLETEIKPNATVFELMSQLQAENKLIFNGKQFGGGLGFFVESINGVKNNDQKNYYWTYYVNGVEARVGISTYKIKSDDIISWKYETR